MRGARAVVTSIVRHTRAGERTGYVRVLDLERKRVLLETAIPESRWRTIDPNPRGGYRGGKGLGFRGDRLVLANSERLFVFDSSWAPISDLSHPWMGSIHDLLPEEDAVWVTCTNCDLLLKLGWDGQTLGHWTWRGDARLARELGYRRVPPFDESCDYRDPRSTKRRLLSLVQLNGVARYDGRLLLSFGRILPGNAYLRRRVAAMAGRIGLDLRRSPTARSGLPAGKEPGSSFALVLLDDAGPARVVHRVDGIAVPNHNVLVADGLVLYNDTHGGRLVEFDLSRSVETRTAAVPGSPGFARGLARLESDLYLVGSQRPAAVHLLDLAAGRVVESIPLSADARESVYNVAVVPDSFDDPPARLTFPDDPPSGGA